MEDKSALSPSTLQQISRSLNSLASKDNISARAVFQTEADNIPYFVISDISVMP